MSKIAVFYGSTTGNTQAAAEEIAKQLGNVDIFDINTTKIEKMLYYDLLVLGSSTWGVGDVQVDWEDVLEEIKTLDINGKKIALFGTGDQVIYEDTFCNAIGVLYETLQNSNVEFIGKYPTSSYQFKESNAVKEGVFVGLPLDEDNQSNLTKKRIEEWIAILKSEIN